MALNKLNSRMVNGQLLPLGPALSGFQLGSTSLPPEYLAALRQFASNPANIQRQDQGDGNIGGGNGFEYTPTGTNQTVRMSMDGGGISGLTLFDNTGISGGSQVLNGRPYYNYDPSGQLTDTGTFSGLGNDNSFGGLLKSSDFGALGMMALPFAAAGLGLGAAGGAGELAGGASLAPGAGLGGGGASLTGGIGTTAGAGYGIGTLPGLAGASYGAGGLGLDSALASMGAAGAAGGVTGALTGSSGTSLLEGGTGAGTGDTIATDSAMDLPAHELTHAGSFTLPGWAGAAASLAGGLLGSKGVNNSQSETRSLPSYLQGPVAQDLIPRTQGLLNSQMPVAQAAGSQMIGQGQGLLGAPVAGNGVGKVTLDTPTTASNPYLTGAMNDIQRRTQEMLDANNLSIQGNAVGVGGLGGSRQGVAQGIGAGKAADYLAGQGANMYLQAYNADQNRSLQKYGQDQSFYGQQRGQDLAQVGVGSGLVGQGLDTQFSPIKNTAQTFAPFTGFGTATQTGQQGGGALGALGGALGTAQLFKALGGSSGGSWW